MGDEMRLKIMFCDFGMKYESVWRNLWRNAGNLAELEEYFCSGWRSRGIEIIFPLFSIRFIQSLESSCQFTS
jgi:hypothetical protein